MSERVGLLLDALDTGSDEFVRVWDELQATPEDLEGLLRAVTPGMTDIEREARLDAAVKQKYGSWPQ
jgi:hypothetical protein